MNPEEQQSRKRRRRNDSLDDPLRQAYEHVQTIVPRESTGRPGSPHRFFASSHTVVLLSDESNEQNKLSDDESTANEGEKTTQEEDGGGGDDDDDDDGGGERTASERPSLSSLLQMTSPIIHQHANGLCIVTAAEHLVDDAPNGTIQSVDFLEDPAPDMSAGERRKRNAKLLRGKKNVGHVVTPCTPIAKLTFDKGHVVVCAGVWGTVLELNRNVTPELLQRDPLLDGYLAVILPTGQFPPPHFANRENGRNKNVPIHKEKNGSH